MSEDIKITVGKNAPGVLITFEGGDGAGKSTHIRFLARTLENLGFDVLCVREPGGTEIGEALRRIVLDPHNENLSPEAELLIYEAARAQLIKEVIKPALDFGGIVLCDRFTDSTIAYQGYGRGLDLALIRAVNAFATLGIEPDCTIVLTCPDRQEKKDRVDRREDADRLERAGDDFHTRVIGAFSEMAEENPDRMHVIETSGKHSATARRIFSVLAGVFPWLADGSIDLSDELDAYDAAHDHSRRGRSSKGDGGASEGTVGGNGRS